MAPQSPAVHNAGQIHDGLEVIAAIFVLLEILCAVLAQNNSEYSTRKISSGYMRCCRDR